MTELLQELLWMDATWCDQQWSDSGGNDQETVSPCSVEQKLSDVVWQGVEELYDDDLQLFILVHKFAPSGVTFPQVHPRPSDGRRA